MSKLISVPNRSIVQCMKYLEVASQKPLMGEQFYKLVKYRGDRDQRHNQE